MAKIASALKEFPKVFWVSNIMELFERWAWYGFYMAFALYLVGSKETGALGFSMAQKGLIMGTGTMMLYFLPLFTGAIADRVGYKKILLLSYTLYIAGYFMVSYFTQFAAVFAAYVFLAFAGALFKPVISAIVSKSTNSSNSSIGFGIFYMMVNIGGFIGPFIAGAVYNTSWNLVFYISMASVAINFLFLFLFFKEPDADKIVDEPFLNVVKTALKNIFITLSNFKYLLFLFIMIAFWSAFNQLYYSFPIFLDDWVDTSGLFRDLKSIFPSLAASIGTAQGTISPVSMSSLNAFFIIGFQILVSGVVMKYKPLNAMISGILILAIGLAVMFITNNGYFAILGMFIFAVGEMASSPKFTEYVGSIAPADKKALYMGTSFLPIAVGHSVAGFISGNMYDVRAGKLTLLQNEVAKQGISIPSISDTFTKTDYYNSAAEAMKMTPQELTIYLWNNYNPSSVWVIYSGIAISAVVALLLYDRFLLKSK